MKRDLFTDLLRAFAVILMIIFHGAYDLNIFHYTDLDFSQGFWFYLPRFITFLFLFCVGKGMDYAYTKGFNHSKFFKRFFKLALGAFVISLSTYFLFPGQWVYFGTLHCIALGSLLTYPLAQHKKLALVFFLLLIVSIIVFKMDFKAISQLGIGRSMDFIPIYPWWVVILGGLLTPNHYFPKLKKLPFFLDFLSKNSLKIYILHQPVIYGCLFLIKTLTS